MRRAILGISLFSLFIAALVFQNCAKTSFSATPGQSNNQTASDAVATCSDARSKGLLKTATTAFQFPEPQADTGYPSACKWNEDGNLSKHGGHMAARVEQSVDFQLPDQSHICGMSFSFTPQEMKYDDAFFFLFDNTIVASDSSWAVTQLQSTPVSLHGNITPFYSYSWVGGLRDLQFPSNANTVAYPYCLGGDAGMGHCSWPITQMTGTIDIQLDPDLVANLGFLNSASQHRFGWVSTGDNDDSTDCRHKPVQFSLVVEYL